MYLYPFNSLNSYRRHAIFQKCLELFQFVFCRFARLCLSIEPSFRFSARFPIVEPRIETWNLKEKSQLFSLTKNDVDRHQICQLVASVLIWSFNDRRLSSLLCLTH